MLSFDFRGFATTYADRLPDRAEVPLLAREESYDRLLLRATHLDPDRRFHSAAEMANSSSGCCARCCRPPTACPGRRCPGSSPRNGGRSAPDAGEVGLTADRPAARPGGGRRRAAAAAGRPDRSGRRLPGHADGDRPGELIALLRIAPVRSVEVSSALRAGPDRRRRPGRRRRRPRPALRRRPVATGGSTGTAASPRWPRTGPADARAAFDAVYDRLPGEPAARLALAAAVESCRRPDARRAAVRPGLADRPRLHQRRLRAGPAPARQGRPSRRAIAFSTRCRRAPATTSPPRWRRSGPAYRRTGFPPGPANWSPPPTGSSGSGWTSSGRPG